MEDPTKKAQGHTRLLLVEDDESDALFARRVIEKELPAFEIVECRTYVQATALLKQQPFSLVLADHRLPDGSAMDVLAFMEAEDLNVPVVVLTGMGGEDVAVAAMKAGAYDFLRKEVDNSHLKTLPLKLSEALRRAQLERKLAEMQLQEEQLKMLRTIRSTVATVNHEINNPLAIISGNAQLLLEMSRVMDLDPELLKPIRDIEEASRRIAQALHKLSNLKEIITRHYASGESDVIDL